MMVFENVLQLPQAIIQLRLHKTDAYAEVKNFLVLPEVGDTYRYLVVIDSTLTEAQIVDLLSGSLTAEETNALQAFSNAADGFNSLPNWSTWSQQDANDYILNNILNGWNQTQVDSYIDTTATSLAGVRTTLKQVGTSLINTRTILINVAKAILFIRDLVVRLRR